MTRGRRKTGPERFWDNRRVQVAFGIAFALSMMGHAAFGPWSFFPSGIEVRDVDGDTTIPVDMIEQGDPPPKADTITAPVSTEEGPGSAARAMTDAGIVDAAPTDAEPDVRDAAPPPDAEPADDAAPPADAGEDAPHDPVAMVGQLGKVQADVALVVLLVNAQEIKKHPVGAKMGGLLSSIPQWDDFIAGTGVDPIQMADWLLISGPGLVNTANDVILVHYNAPDSVVDHAIDVISKKSFNGGPFDAGVPGMRAAIGTADRAPRVFLRPRKGLLAVVPPFYASKAAALLMQTKGAPKIRAGEAMRLTLKKPYQPFPDIPKTVTEVRMWIVPTPSGGAEVFAEGDCASDADATDATTRIGKVFDTYRGNLLVRAFTHGLLNSLDIHPEGSQVKLHLVATEDQLEALLTLVGGQINSMKSTPAPPPAKAPPAVPSAAPTGAPR